MRLALYQPDIAQNVGAAIRTAACFGADLDIIGPCGFPLSAKEIWRVAMDYQLMSAPTVHDDWQAFLENIDRPTARLILLTTKATTSLWETPFGADDIILMGRESAGVPDSVHAEADGHARIEMSPDARSLNMATAAAIALAEARRQVGWP